MDDTTPSPLNTHATTLLQKYRARTISLAECQELRRYLEERVLNDVRTSSEQRLAASFIVSGLKAVILDKKQERDHP